MKFVPARGYIQVEEAHKTEEKGNFQWEKPAEDLCVVKILATGIEDDEDVGGLAIVISNLIQKFEFKKKLYKIVPDNAVVGYLDKDED